MKTQASRINLTPPSKAQGRQESMAPAAPRRAGQRVSAAAILLLLGGVMLQPGNAAQAPVSRVAGPIPPELETIAVTAPDAPAKFSFDQAKGRTGYAGDAAGDAARACLEPARHGDPALNAVLGSAGAVVAPFAATYAAITTGRRKLSSERLSDSEANLAQAMALMADQRHLRERFLNVASEKCRRRLIAAEALAGLPANSDPVGGMLETRVEELRLERTGSSDASFALRVKARARLLRATDGATLFDQPFEYRSGKGLFLDWTLHGVLPKLAENAYRELAEQMVAQLFETPFDHPVLVGAGFKKSPPRPARSRGMLVAGLRPQTFAQFVNHPVGVAGPVGVWSIERPDQLTIQVPLTKTEAVSEAVSDVDWSLDGLQDSHNPLVSVPACAVAIPISLWKQTAGAVFGLGKKQQQTAVAQLSAATQRSQPHAEVASQVALQLAPRTSQPVMLVNTRLRQEGAGTTGAPGSGVFATWVRSARTSPKPSGLPGPIPDTVLQIEVLNAGLKGEERVNPHLALCVEVQATLWRVNDGRLLGSFPIHYRSTERKFVDWAAHDARWLQQELKQCYRELGRAMVDQIAPPSLMAPDRALSPVLASNSK